MRAIGMTLVHAAGQTAMSFVRASAPDRVPIAEASILGLLVAVAFAWGVADGWFRRDGAATGWLVTALVTGPVAGLLGVISRAAFVDATGTSALWPALTGGAAFTALLVLLPAVAGIGVASLSTPPGLRASAVPAHNPRRRARR